MKAAAKRKAPARKKRALLRLTLPNNEYKHVTRDGYIQAIATGNVFLPQTTTQAQLHVRDVAVHIDVRDRAVVAGPYAPPSMNVRLPPNVYVVIGFYDPLLSHSRQNRRVVIMVDGHIALANDDGHVTYYVLGGGTKIITTC